MATCDIEQLLNDGRCYLQLTEAQQRAAQLQLLCDILGDGTFLGPKGATGPAWAPTHASLAYAAAVTPDFDEDYFRTISLTGDIDFTASTNRLAGAQLVIRVLSDAVIRNLTFNANWIFVGAKPATIAALKTGVLTLTCYGANESDIVANWLVEA